MTNYAYDAKGNTLTKVESSTANAGQAEVLPAGRHGGQRSTSFTYDNKNQLVEVRYYTPNEIDDKLKKGESVAPAISGTVFRLILWKKEL